MTLAKAAETTRVQENYLPISRSHLIADASRSFIVALLEVSAAFRKETITMNVEEKIDLW